jgi:hypothetical protein
LFALELCGTESKIDCLNAAPIDGISSPGISVLRSQRPEEIPKSEIVGTDFPPSVAHNWREQRHRQTRCEGGNIAKGERK